MSQAQTQQQAAGPSTSRTLQTSLYVGDLEPNVTEAQLFELFRQVAPVVSIRVCRDHLITGRPLAYAYVGYNTVQDATRALELLNFTPVNGKAIRVMLSNRDPTGRNSGKANIFIKNLEKSIDGKALFNTFSPFGSILSCKVPTTGSGQSKGYGFVQFELEESARSAIENVNGMLLNDRQVFVTPFIPRHDRHLSEESSKFTNVYVKNISKYMTDEELSNRFGAFGAISNAIVMRTRDGKSKRFGFVNFERADDAARAVLALNGRRIDSEKEWYVERAQTKSEREADLSAKFKQSEPEKYPFNLYIKNLDYTVDEDKLRELFAEFGAITSCKVLRDEQGQSRRFGFVAFSTAQAANRAITNMCGRMVGSKPLYVALAENEEERRAGRLQRYGLLATPEAQFTPTETPFEVGPAKPPMYLPVTRGIGQQSVSYGQQPAPALISPQPAAFSNQKQMLAGIRPGVGQIPNFDVRFVPKQVKQGHHPAQEFRRGDAAPQQQIVPRGGYPSFYKSNARNTSNLAESSQGIIGSRISHFPSMEVKIVNTGVLQPSRISALTSALASAPPDEQRATLGEQLYPMVDKLEHDHAQTVTGMLLQLDQAEVLYLIESPEALMAKISEAMDLLRIAAQAAASTPTDRSI